MPLCAAFIFKDLLFICAYVCMTTTYVFMHVAAGASRGQQGASDLPVVGVTGHKPLVVGAGN